MPSIRIGRWAVVIITLLTVAVVGLAYSFFGTSGVVALGTVALALTGGLQVHLEQSRQAREARPWLLMTGAKAGRWGCRVEVNNLSPHPIAVDGVYANWHQPERDRRLDFDARTSGGPVSFHRTVLQPGGFLTRWHPFPRSGNTKLSGRASEKNPDYLVSEARLTVEFYYPQRSADKLAWSWDVRLERGELCIMSIGDHW